MITTLFYRIAVELTGRQADPATMRRDPEPEPPA